MKTFQQPVIMKHRNAKIIIIIIINIGTRHYFSTYTFIPLYIYNSKTGKSKTENLKREGRIQKAKSKKQNRKQNRKSKIEKVETKK